MAFSRKRPTAPTGLRQVVTGHLSAFVNITPQCGVSPGLGGKATTAQAEAREQQERE